MQKIKLCALLLAVVIAGTAIAPTVAYAAPGVTVPPASSPLEGWEEFEQAISEIVAPYVKLDALKALYNEVETLEINYTKYTDIARIMQEAQQEINKAEEGLIGKNDESLTKAYLDLSKVVIMYGFNLNWNMDGVPTIADYSTLYESAKASIAGLNKAEALKTAVDAVDNQIPDWNVWKYVPRAMEQVAFGRACATVEGIAIQCRQSGYSAQYMSTRALIPDTDKDGNYIEGWDQLPEVTQLENKSLAEILAYAKAQPLYASDPSFAELVDNAQNNYDEGVATLKSTLDYLSNSNFADGLNAQALVNALESRPRASLYGISTMWESNEDSLYWQYANALHYFREKFPAEEYGYEGASDAYAGLVVAATKINPDFAVDLSSVPAVPTAPNTGDSETIEMTGMVIKIAVAGIAIMAAVFGAAITTKRYLFSPLKRK